eukprot:SAG22_NODE_243_length_14055_cov_3.073015_11_plen_46_part_00
MAELNFEQQALAGQLQAHQEQLDALPAAIMAQVGKVLQQQQQKKV